MRRYKDLAAQDPQTAELALALYCATVRATLFVCKGYECQEKEVGQRFHPNLCWALLWTCVPWLSASTNQDCVSCRESSWWPFQAP